jgi:hypothetical protein
VIQQQVVLNLISARDLVSKWKTEGAFGHNIMPEIEAAFFEVRTMAENTRRKLLGGLAALPMAAWFLGKAEKPASAHKFSAPESGPEVMQKRFFPNVELVTHEGKTVRFYDDLLKGKIVLRAQFSKDKMKVLLREHIEADLLKLEQRVNSFIRQLADFLPMEALPTARVFSFFPPTCELRPVAHRRATDQRPVSRLLSC